LMKAKFLIVLGLALLAMVDVSEAGWRCGRSGGGYWGGGGYYGGGGYWGRGYYGRGGYWGRGWGGPYWGGGYWGGWGPSIGISFVAPVPAYRTVYVTRPAPVYGSYSAPAYGSYSAPALYRAQARLARLGYYPGPIDGDFGPMTSRAIRRYQADYGLPVTGRLDYRTRSSLGV
jgi:hypothetical protein